LRKLLGGFPRFHWIGQAGDLDDQLKIRNPGLGRTCLDRIFALGEAWREQRGAKTGE
jgi:hypothetical protein